jgi:ketosteroid isomerase-like protein
MKQILSIALVITSTASMILAQAQKKATPTTAVERQLIELERELSDALVTGDRTVLDRLWSDDLIFTFPDGKMSNKARRMAAQKPPDASSQSTNTNDQVKVYLYGHAALVTVLSTWKGKAGTQEYSDQYQATHVWAKQQGRWQLVAAHVSQVKN